MVNYMNDSVCLIFLEAQIPLKLLNSLGVAFPLFCKYIVFCFLYDKWHNLKRDCEITCF